MTKLRVALLFGGCSGEHEVSITSAKAIANALSIDPNPSKYEVVPIYIEKNGVWHRGTEAEAVLESGQPLTVTGEVIQ
ncbi:D-alanine--D-alanine ligase, partial [Arthrospira sp. O9.13F]